MCMFYNMSHPRQRKKKQNEKHPYFLMNQLKKKKEYKNNNNIYLKIRIYQTNGRQGKKKRKWMEYFNILLYDFIKIDD